MIWVRDLAFVAASVLFGLVAGGLSYRLFIYKIVPIRPNSQLREDALSSIDKSIQLNQAEGNGKDSASQQGASQRKEETAAGSVKGGAPASQKKGPSEAELQLKKLLQPAYAIAIGYFSQASYDGLQSKFNTYSDTALGLVFAFAMLAFSLVGASYVGSLLSCLILIALFLVTALLFVVALGARDMFLAAVRNALLIAIQVQMDASNKAKVAAQNAAGEKKKATAREDDLKTAIRAELKDVTLTIKGLVVDLDKLDEEEAT